MWSDYQRVKRGKIERFFNGSFTVVQRTIHFQQKNTPMTTRFLW